jgi:hypothetical protein
MDLAPWLFLALLAPTAPAAAQQDPLVPRWVDPDGDGDGLSDFQEVHKYLTDPVKADSDGDGKADGGWDGAAKGFRLEPDQGDAIPARAIRGYWILDSSLFFVLRIADEDRARMRSGERYRIVPDAPEEGPRFTAGAELAIQVPP